LREVPASVRAEINLPRGDCGIDLIARHRSGAYWAIQAKFRTDEEGPLGWGELGTFAALSALPRQNISQTVVAHTCARPVGRRPDTRTPSTRGSTSGRRRRRWRRPSKTSGTASFSVFPAQSSCKRVTVRAPLGGVKRVADFRSAAHRGAETQTCLKA
jgi:hypothetical protein